MPFAFQRLPKTEGESSISYVWSLRIFQLSLFKGRVFGAVRNDQVDYLLSNAVSDLFLSLSAVIMEGDGAEEQVESPLKLCVGCMCMSVYIFRARDRILVLKKNR